MSALTRDDWVFDDRADSGHVVQAVEDGFVWMSFDPDEEMPVAGSPRAYPTVGDALRAAADEWEGCGGDRRTATKLRLAASRADQRPTVGA